MIYVVLFVAGIIAGVMNTVAGGGSILTLPVLIFCGFPAMVANATNRIGIIVQGLVAIQQFRKKNIFETRLTFRVVLTGLIGAVLGVKLATLTGDQQFEKVLGILMLGLLLLLIYKPKTLLSKGGESDYWVSLRKGQQRNVMGIFFLLGIYAGYIQAGVGILVLLILGTVVKMDLIRGNFVKLVFVFALNILALLTFLASGVEVEWVAGVVLMGGQMIGAYAGSWVAIQKGEQWVFRFLIVAIVLSSAKLLGLFNFILPA